MKTHKKQLTKMMIDMYNAGFKDGCRGMGKLSEKEVAEMLERVGKEKINTLNK